MRSPERAERVGGRSPEHVEGPSLAELLRHLAEDPEALARDARVRAVLRDLFESLGVEAPESAEAFPPGTAPAERNRRRWALAAARLLWHPAFRRATPRAAPLHALFLQDLAAVAAIVPADRLRLDEERREELIRRTLRAAGMRPAGESETEADARFEQVDSIERSRVVREAAAREKRAREVREAMRRKEAEEAAARVSRE